MMNQAAMPEMAKRRASLDRYIKKANNQGLYQRVIGLSPKHFAKVKAYGVRNGHSSIGESVSEMISDFAEASSYLDERAITETKKHLVGKSHMTSFYLSDEDFNSLKNLSRSAGMRVSSRTGIALLIESLDLVGLA